MKKLGIILILFMGMSPVLFGQMQYTSVPKNGEGRFERTSTAAFWVNPIFFKPSIFFSSDQASSRANRKWWRAEKRMLPVPNTGVLETSMTPLAECAFISFTGENLHKDLFPSNMTRSEQKLLTKTKDLSVNLALGL